MLADELSAVDFNDDIGCAKEATPGFQFPIRELRMYLVATVSRLWIED